jgi:toxin CptA
MTSAPAIGFEYRPSRWLSRLLVLVSTLAIFALCLSAVPWPIKACGSLILIVVLWRTLSRWLSTPVDAAGWARDGSWSLRIRAGEDAVATLSSYRVVGETMVWLRLALPGRRYIPLLLAPDNSDADIRRRLRMRLAQIEAAGHSGR